MNKKLFAAIGGVVLLVALILFAVKADGHNDGHNRFIKPNERGMNLSNSDFHCLVDNIYHEAGNQPWVGKMAVAYVTINRVKDERWPSSICEVVWQKTATSTCQFSWTCQIDKVKRRKINEQWWNESQDVVYEIMKVYDPYSDPIRGATHFHATYVKPNWGNKLYRVVTINDHIFYR
jgi:spore germination cell wall hydrolase CwlJ-like protein